jgi:putative addiction module antidote
MYKLKLRKVGNSLGLILPAEAVKALEVREGDTLYLTGSPEGMRMTTLDPDFERQMRIAEEGMREYRDALRALADR